MDNATKADMAAYTGCIAGALTRDEFTDALRQAGLVDIEIQETPPRPRLSRLGGRLRGQAPRELPNQSADHLLQAPGQGRWCGSEQTTSGACGCQ